MDAATATAPEHDSTHTGSATRPAGLLCALAVILPTTAACGSLLPGIGRVFAFRLLVIFWIAFAALVWRGLRVSNQSTRRFATLTTVWVFVALVLTFFVQDFSLVSKGLVPVFLGLPFIFTMTRMATAKGLLNHLARGWTLSFVITGAIALREIFQHQHLANYLVDTDPLEVDTRLTASVFGNPNAYAAYLVTVLPILILGVTRSRSRILQTAYGAMTLALLGLLLSTGSRTCMVAAVVQLACLPLFTRQALRGQIVRLMAVGAILAVAFSWALGSGLAAYLPQKVQAFSLSSLADEATQGNANTSGGTRLNLYKDGISAVLDRAGMGLGPGQFEAYMGTGRAPYPTAGVTSPHNVYLEVASEYGIIVLMLLLAWIAAAFRICFLLTQAADPSARAWGLAMTLAITGNAISGIANSAFIPGSVNWMFMATLMLVTVTFPGRPSVMNVVHSAKQTISPSYSKTRRRG